MQYFISNPLTNLFWTQSFFAPHCSFPNSSHWENAALLIKCNLDINSVWAYLLNPPVWSSQWKLLWEGRTLHDSTHTHFSTAVSCSHVWPLTMHGYFFFLYWCIFSLNNKEHKRNAGTEKHSWELIGSGKWLIYSECNVSVMRGGSVDPGPPATASSCPAQMMNVTFTSLNKEHFSVFHDTWKVHEIQLILFINTFYLLSTAKLLLLWLAEAVLWHFRLSGCNIETIQPSKPKIITIWPFPENACWALD